MAAEPLPQLSASRSRSSCPSQLSAPLTLSLNLHAERIMRNGVTFNVYLHVLDLSVNSI